MIFFSGFGLLVAPVVVVGFLIPMVLEWWVKKQFGYAPPNWLVMTAAALLPFLGILNLDYLLIKYGPTRKATDKKTGAEVEIAEMHTFMFMPVRWCAFIWLGLVICITVACMVH
jgi:hypothetical protein